MSDLIPSDYDPSTLQSLLPSYLQSYLTSLPSSSSLQPVQLKLLNLCLLQCLKISKSQKLNTTQLPIYTTILFQTILNNSTLLFHSPSSTSTKTIEDDWVFLEQKINQNNEIEGEQLVGMLKEFKRYYFDNFEIFKVAFEENVKPQGKRIALVVDRPQVMPSLAAAVERPLQVVIVDDEEEDN